MDRPLQSALQSIGVSEKAAAIYLTLLKHPRVTTAQIARASGVKRATCYEHLDELLRLGLVLREPRGKRMFFMPIEPKQVLASYRQQLSCLEKSVAEMTKLYEDAISKPKITYLEGKNALRTIYEDLFKTVGDVYSIFPATTFFEHFTDADYEAFEHEISRHAIKSRDLFFHDRYYKKIKEIRAKTGIENKFDKKLPADFQSNIDVVIYADKVGLIDLRDLSALIIENKNIASLFRSIHTFIWKAV